VQMFGLLRDRAILPRGAKSDAGIRRKSARAFAVNGPATIARNGESATSASNRIRLRNATSTHVFKESVRKAIDWAKSAIPSVFLNREFASKSLRDMEKGN
jgi:hypothetical protein